MKIITISGIELNTRNYVNIEFIYTKDNGIFKESFPTRSNKQVDMHVDNLITDLIYSKKCIAIRLSISSDSKEYETLVPFNSISHINF